MQASTAVATPAAPDLSCAIGDVEDVTGGLHNTRLEQSSCDVNQSCEWAHTPPTPPEPRKAGEAPGEQTPHPPPVPHGRPWWRGEAMRQQAAVRHGGFQTDHLKRWSGQNPLGGVCPHTAPMNLFLETPRTESRPGRRAAAHLVVPLRVPRLLAHQDARHGRDVVDACGLVLHDPRAVLDLVHDFVCIRVNRR